MNNDVSVVRSICDCTGLTDDAKITIMKMYLLGWSNEEAVKTIVAANNRFVLDADGCPHLKEGEQ